VEQHEWGYDSEPEMARFSLACSTGVSTEKAKIDAVVGTPIRSKGGPARHPRAVVQSPSPIADVGHISWGAGGGRAAADIERSTDGTNFSVIKNRL